MSGVCYVPEEKYVYPEVVIYPPEVPYELEEEDDES